MRRETLALILLASLLAAPVSGMASKPRNGGGGFDASPCLDLLAGMLESIPRGDGGSFNQSLWWFSQIPVPKEMKYIHSRMAELVSEVAYNAWAAENMLAEAERLLAAGKCGEALEEARRAEGRLINAFSARSMLVDEGLLSRYVSSASSRINDTGLRFLLERRMSLAEAGVKGYLETLKDELAGIEARASQCRMGERLILTLSLNATEIHPAETLMVWGRLTDHGKPIRGGEIAVTLRLGGAMMGGEAYTDEDGRYSILIRIPGIGGRPRIEWSVSRRTDAVIYAVYRGAGGLVVFNETAIRARALNPEAVFTCPRSQDYGEPIKIPVSLMAGIPMNTTVYMDGMPIRNTTIRPGRSIIEIPWNKSFTAGYHTLSFKLYGEGSYAGATYSCALAVGVESPAIDVIVGYISVYPFSDLLVKGSIIFPKPGTHRIIVAVGGEKHDLGVLKEGNITLSLRLTPPPALLIGFHTLTIRVINAETGFASTVKYPVVVINPLGMLAASVFVLIMMAAPPRRDLIRLSSLFVARIRRSLRRGRAAGGAVRSLGLQAGWRSRIAPIYYAVLGIVARIAGRMAPSDTLREYLAKASPKLEGRLRRLFADLTIIFEKDLYSRLKAGSMEVEEARRLAREIRRGG